MKSQSTVFNGDPSPDRYQRFRNTERRRLLLCVAVLTEAFTFSFAFAKLPPTGSPSATVLTGQERRTFFAQRKLALKQIPQPSICPLSLLVQFKPAATDAERAATRSLIGGRIIRQYSLVPNLEHLWVEEDVESALTKINGHPQVLHAEFDNLDRISSYPNDPDFEKQWALHNVNMPFIWWGNGVVDADIDALEAWQVTTGDPSVIVAVIDLGVDFEHPDLAPNIWTNSSDPINGQDDDLNGFVDDYYGWDFADDDNDPRESPGDNHGTRIAGIIGAVQNNGIGVSGVCPNARIMALRGGGDGVFFVSAAIAALEYAVQMNARISNHSYGRNTYSGIEEIAINQARAAGHLFVAAAGNDGSNNDDQPFYPASLTSDNIISVAAISRWDEPASFTNLGPSSVDLAAPGVRNLTTSPGGLFHFVDGTSYASPHVAGVAALVWSLHGDWDYRQVRQQILDSTRPLPLLAGRCVTGGVVNAAAAMGATNDAPLVSINSPQTKLDFFPGNEIQFTATVSDEDDGLQSSLIWTSNLQGHIGTGASFTTSQLLPGKHWIKAAVTDTQGLAGAGWIELMVEDASQSRFYVSPVGEGDMSGSSWDNAMNSIFLSSFNFFTDDPRGQEFWLKSGTYDFGFAIYGGYRIYGGFAGGETSKAERDMEANPVFVRTARFSSPFFGPPDIAGADAIIDGVSFTGTDISVHIFPDASLPIRSR